MSRQASDVMVYPEHWIGLFLKWCRQVRSIKVYMYLRAKRNKFHIKEHYFRFHTVGPALISEIENKHLIEFTYINKFVLQVIQMHVLRENSIHCIR